MPRFYFGLVDETGLSPDEFGVELDSIEAAYLEGCRAALEISFDRLAKRRSPAGLHFEISDAKGLVVLELPFAEVLDPDRRDRPSCRSGSVLESLRSQLTTQRRLTAEFADILAQTSRTLTITRQLLSQTAISPDYLVGGLWPAED